MQHCSLAVLALLALLLVAPANANAQDRGTGNTITLEAFGGLSDFGRFLEQDFGGGERELTGSTVAAFGGSVGVWPWERTGVRVGFTWTPTELEFVDDTGTDSDLLDVDDLADLNAYVFSFEVMRFLLDGNRRLAPYATAGFSATIWNLDEEGDNAGQIIANEDDDTEARFGGVGAIGVQYSVNPDFALRLEASTFALGNPFDGNDAFQVTTGDTFDEPDIVTVKRFTLGLTYSFHD